MQFKKGILVEFKDKSPGSTGLSHTGTYEYLGECEMKDSSQGWVSAVMYSKDGHLYVRNLEDFIKKFKPCE